MASYSVQYIFSLIDRFTPSARKMGSAAQVMSKTIHAAGRSAQAAASGVGRFGAAAGRAANQVAAFNKQAVLMAKQKSRSFFGRGSNMGGFAGLAGLTGGFFTGRKILSEAREASKAENKFRSLVDSVNDEQMANLKEGIFRQMKYTGESFGSLMDAAGDAAQIVGNADLAGNITMAASSLAKIDTASKDTAYFAESLASVIGPGGTMADVAKIADMLAQQQKLGAATAGGTIEAYKKTIGLKGITRFDPVAVMSSIGLIKNMAPALQDAEIGTQALYGIRMLTLPNTADRKKLKAAGFDPKDFLDKSGAFDLVKAHQLLYALSQGENGQEKLKALFSGRNVQAGKFWLSLLQKTPEDMVKYMNDLIDSQGTLWDALKKRVVGLDGALTRLEGSGKEAAIAIGEWVTPTITKLADIAEGAVESIRPMLQEFTKNHPALSSFAAGALVAAAGLSVLALPLAAVVFALRMLGGGLLMRVLAGLGGGLIAGLAGSAATLGRMASAFYRVAGAAGLARFAARGLLRMFGIGIAIEGLILVVENFDKIKQAASEALAVVKELWNTGKIDTGKGSAYNDLNKRLENTWFGRTAIALGLAKPVDELYPQLMQGASIKSGVMGPFQGKGPMGPFPAAEASRIPQAVNVQSHTSFDPASITVNVTGQVNGPLQGTGSGTLNARPSRGAATSEAGPGLDVLSTGP